MTRDNPRQFPPLSALDWPDPALIDRPIGECEPQPSRLLDSLVTLAVLMLFGAACFLFGGS